MDFLLQLIIKFTCFTFVLLIPLVSSVPFNISRFDSNLTNIIYDGDAMPSLGVVDFNVVNYLYRVGHVTYAKAVILQDSTTKQVADFSTHFSFTIDTENRTLYGHGLAFFIAPIGFQIPQNSGGGFLGLFNNTTSDSPLNRIVFVEFDSFENPEWDPSDIGGHVGINVNSIHSAIYTPWNATYHSGDAADVFITYNATIKNLTVSWRYHTSNNPDQKSSLSYHIDLTKVLPSRVTIGFSASTGQNVERHILNSWQFSSSLNEETTNKRTDNIKIIAASLALFGALLIGTVVAFLMLSKGRRKQRNESDAISLTSTNNVLQRGSGPRRYSYKDLASATNNFSDDRKLGQGGFGAVYKGHLAELGTDVAVKKISKSSKQGKKEFLTEVQAISQLRHRNLVQLLGWCLDRGQFLLVYEFLPNGSFDSHLFDKNCNLTWATRHKICLGLASALLYLHDEGEQCVVHRDIKTSNLMLDSKFNVKLSDFGLARLMDHEIGPQTTGLAGTLGYLAPEYIRTCRPTTKTDVFSFGIVTLELATGRRSIDPRNYEMGLLEWAWDLYGRDALLSAIDERLHTEFDVKEATYMILIGLWCAHPDHSLRPSIKQVIQVLNFESEPPDLPKTMPVPVYQVTSPNESSSSEPLLTDSLLEGGR